MYHFMHMLIPKPLAQTRQILHDKALKYFTEGGCFVFTDTWKDSIDSGLILNVAIAEQCYQQKDLTMLESTIEKLKPLLKTAKESPDVLRSLVYLPMKANSEIGKAGKHEMIIANWDSRVALRHPVFIGYYIMQQYAKLREYKEDVKIAKKEVDKIIVSLECVE